LAPGTHRCPCPCLTGVEMTLRVRGCRGAQPCPCGNDRNQASSQGLSPTVAVGSPPSSGHQGKADTFLSVAAAATATSYVNSSIPQQSLLAAPVCQPSRPKPSSLTRSHSTASGRVLPSSHLLDHLGCKGVSGPRVSILSPKGHETADVPRPAARLSSRSFSHGCHSSRQGAINRISTNSFTSKREREPWSLANMPKRPGRFSSRRNRSTNANAHATAGHSSLKHRSHTSNSHPDF
ncbi:hypothetical protein SK128_013197, partial [Halocaridina rubra]